MKYIIKYKAMVGRMVDDAWLAENFAGIYPDEDARRARRFESKDHADYVLKVYRNLGGDGREPGVVEEVAP